MSRGNIIGAKSTLTATYTGGVWNLSDQLLAVRSGYWPKDYGFVGATSGLVMYVDAGNPSSYSGSGSTWRDLTGNVSSGTLYNSPTYNSGNGGYFSFNGSNQYASFPNSSALDNQSFTMELWVKPNNLSQNGFWFEKGTVNSQYAFFMESSVIRFRINGSDYVSPSTSYLSTSSWNHVTATYTYGTNKIYLNGSLLAQAAPNIVMNSNANGMSIGAYGGTSGSNSYFFNGSIALCRIYSRDLSATEVQANYNSQKSRFGL